MKALGMIEVIGLPPAIEAADAALKAANVELLAIAKADAGILTVEITGDVDAVTAAVEAGAVAAGRVGTLRAKHVIARVDESLAGKVIIQGTKLFQTKQKTMNQITRAEPTADINEVKEGVIREKIELGTEEKKIEEKLEQRIEEKAEEELEQRTKEKAEEKLEQRAEEKAKEKEEKNTEKIIYTAADLKKKSNDTLRTILQSHGVELTEQHRHAKKQELIQQILMIQNDR